MYPTVKYNKFKKFIENNLCLSENLQVETWIDSHDYDVFNVVIRHEPEINGVMGEYFLVSAKSNVVKISCCKF